MMKIAAYPVDFSKWKMDMIRRAFGLHKVQQLTSLEELK
jgi:hypothetical protein